MIFSKMQNALNDKDFLIELDSLHHKEIFARVVALNLAGLPLERIEGRITSGSINVDGTSAIRRSCSLSLVAQDLNINNYYWGEKTKFTLEIGIKNTINSQYPDIIWFKQGIFVITSFSTSHGINNYSISISGKDKMCLLNGELAGNLPASVDFGVEEVIDYIYVKKDFKNSLIPYKPSQYFYKNDKDEYILDESEQQDTQKEYYEKQTQISLVKNPIKKIITEMLLAFGNETIDNIVINDLMDYGLELLEYRGESPCYMLYDIAKQEYTNLIVNSNQVFYYDKECTEQSKITVSTIKNYNTAVANFSTGDTVYFKSENNPVKAYKVSKIEYGNTAGYRLTDLVYAGDLISSIGETVTSILDKLIQMLGNFEYFYDIDGRFIFQEKKNYINTSWLPIKHTDEDIYIENAAFASKSIYNFQNNILISAFNNQPQLTNVKNDYVIWGQRKGISGATIPIHMRYTIDKKPIYYKTFDGIEYLIDLKYSDTNYKSDVSQTTQSKIKVVDWREIIFQMAKDFYQHNQEDDFYVKIMQNNKNENNISYYPNGKTGYEKYYTDIFSFWRELYNPFETTNDNYGYNKTNYYILESQVPEDAEDKTLYATVTENDIRYKWNRNIDTYPEALNFWLDFIDCEGELSKFSIPIIGDRPKVDNNNKVTSIYFRETPSLIFYSEDVKDRKSGYVYCKLPQNMTNLFSISSQGQSAKSVIDNMLYNHSYCTESVNITALPIYYLEPNNLIHIYDKESNVNGNYFISKISLPLTYNGTMSITATKAVDRLI